MDDAVTGSALGIELEQVAHSEARLPFQDVIDLPGPLDDLRRVVHSFRGDLPQREPDSSVSAADAGLQGANSGRAELEDGGQVLHKERRTTHSQIVAGDIGK